MSFSVCVLFAAPLASAVGSSEVTADTVRRQVVSVSADRGESAFSCDSAALVCVYDFCKHTMFATPFAGLFADGDCLNVSTPAPATVTWRGQTRTVNPGSLEFK